MLLLCFSLCSSLCIFLCWILEFVVGFVLQASRTVVLFLCSLLQSSLQIFGQTDGLLEICVLRLAKKLCFFSCSLLQSSLQILGQTHGLLEILSKVVSWFRQWPGQVAPWPRWPWGQADTSFQFYNPLLFAFEQIPKLWPICCRNPKPSRSTNHQFFNPPLFAFGPNCCRNPRIWKLQMPNSGI